jgi:hypothetical protein
MSFRIAFSTDVGKKEIIGTVFTDSSFNIFRILTYRDSVRFVTHIYIEYSSLEIGERGFFCTVTINVN